MNADAGSLSARAGGDPWACVAVIDRHLGECLRELTRASPASLREAMEYAVFSGGKRLRPVLAWHACAACGVAGEASLVASPSLELVHAFSLVHDDLPALDDDDLRRGKATVHKRFGEALAILAGDALLSAAFETIPTHSKDELAGATRLMIDGQVADTLGELEHAGQDAAGRVHSIHARKTAALIAASCRTGVRCAEAALSRSMPRELSDVTKYAEALGLLFQITDDLLDATGTLEQTGKRTRKDAQAGKLTFPGVLGVEGARAMVRELAAEAEGAAHRFGNAGGDMLAMIARQMAERTA